MKLRFLLDQSVMFRKGLDAPKSVVHVDINPAVIDPLVRCLIADRMHGINVHALEGVDRKRSEELITADGPSFDDLVEAVQKNEAELKQITNA